VGIGSNLIGRKIGEEIKKFIRLIFEARKDDTRNALLYNSAGEDSVPLNDERIILVKVDGTGKYAAAGVLTSSQGAKPGEKIFFARDPDAAIVSKISMLNDGSVITEADGDVTQKTKKIFNVSAAEDIALNAEKKAMIKGTDVEINGSTKITGGKLECNGIASPTGTGCWCAKPFCTWDGSPHTGNIAQGT
jgi:hypothetical protein